MGEVSVIAYRQRKKPRVSLAGWLARGWGVLSLAALAGVQTSAWWDDARAIVPARILQEGAAGLFMACAASLPVGWLLSILLSRRLSEWELIWLFWASTMPWLAPLLLQMGRMPW